MGWTVSKVRFSFDLHHLITQVSHAHVSNGKLKEETSRIFVALLIFMSFQTLFILHIDVFLLDPVGRLISLAWYHRSKEVELVYNFDLFISFMNMGVLVILVMTITFVLTAFTIRKGWISLFLSQHRRRIMFASRRHLYQCSSLYSYRQWRISRTINIHRGVRQGDTLS